MAVHSPVFDGIESLFESDGERTKIPSGLRQPLEAALNCDLSDVRISMAPGLRYFHAKACARGDTILYSPLAPDLRSPEGVAVLGHELAHVLQQRRGRMDLARDAAVVIDAELEAEADRIGQHCAAQLYPGIVSDPGVPVTSISCATRRSVGGRPPIQFLISSKESYDAFVKQAWGYLTTTLTNETSAVSILNELYRYAMNFNLQNVEAKTALFGKPLYENMEKYILATKPRRIAFQFKNDDWPDITDEVDNLAKYYLDKSIGNSPFPPIYAEGVAQGYLHVYPESQSDGNWRIAVNIDGSSMAAAMAALAPLIDSEKYPCIDHMKFLGPGNVCKADSALVYVNRDGDNYDEFRIEVIKAASGLSKQHRAGAMWEEVGEGVAEASEPPPAFASASFTQYRCLVTYLAYWKYSAMLDIKPDIEKFRLYLAEVMEIFGIDVAKPYCQGPLQIEDESYAVWKQAMLDVGGEWGVF